jgi:diguanylate cyclase (GGDEF)-like protein
MGLSAAVHIGAIAIWCAAAGGAGAAIRLLINVRDFAQLSTTRREALTDDLTGLANRRALVRHLQENSDAGVQTALAILDLDKFKEVNDGLGHACGDQLLQLVGRRLELALRDGEMVARLGGDEFAVVARRRDQDSMGSSPAEWLEGIGTRLTEAFASPFYVGDRCIHISSSVGTTSNLDNTAVGAVKPLTPIQLLQQADAAMYEAKRSRQRFATYSDELDEDASGRLALLEELRIALIENQLVLHYQPQVNMATDQVVGVEALVRWTHPQRGLLTPDEFLPLAEMHGLMGGVTDRILVMAFSQSARWLEAGTPMRVSVNLSASSLVDDTLPRRVSELLQSEHVAPSSITFELTENVLMSDLSRSLTVLASLKTLGATISIDDFGTGYSSLSSLRQLPIAELKLDRTFTAELVNDRRAAAIVASTIELAHVLQLRVIAEGVEDIATFLRLAELGCDESQGFFHSPALPPHLFDSWLRRRHDLLKVKTLATVDEQ